MPGPKSKYISLDEAFALLEGFAIRNERCPVTSGPCPHPLLKRNHFSGLARQGRIFIEIGSANWRRVTIMTGPHKGKATQANPHLRSRVYQTIGAEGTKLNGKLTDVGSASRSKPWDPTQSRNLWTDDETTTVLYKRDVEKKPWKQIAIEMGRPLTTCQSHWTDAKRPRVVPGKVVAFDRAAKVVPEEVIRDRNHRANLPPRNLTAAFFGDPPIGYSALEQRS